LPRNRPFATLIAPVMPPFLTRLARLAVAAAALAAPGLAHAAPEVSAHTVVRPRVGTIAVPSHGTFHFVGVHWAGPGTVEVRTRSTAGVWSPWRTAAPEPEDGPDVGSVERGAPGRHVGSPWWVGASDRLRLRTRGSVSWARAWLVRSPASLVPRRRLAAAVQPAIVPRASWGADESLRRNEPAFAPEVRYAVVHHTAGSNAYTRAEAPAVVRAIMRYHVQSNGWNDIGYNLLVDRFGTVYEGRFGGVDANVVGAHAVGFNTGSVGVALIGTYAGTAVPTAAERALARLLAWRLDLAHVDTLARPVVTSGGSPKYAAGLPVTLRAVSGHRDVGLTECPGGSLYARLSSLASEASRTGLPKIYEPVVEAAGTSVAFRARLSSALEWTVTVRDAAGSVVASGTGSGAAVDWAWDTTGAPLADYAWRIEAGSGSSAATPADGVIRAGGAPAVLAVSAVSASPAVVSPNGDGADDVATVAYTLSAPATVAVTAIGDSGTGVVAVEPARWRRAGAHSAAFDAVQLPDGRYALVVEARDAAGAVASAEATVVVSRLLGRMTVSPAVVSPNGDGRADTVRAAFTLTRPAAVTVRVRRGASAVATVHRGQLGAGRHALRWDGRKPTGVVGDGAFTLAVEARDALSPVVATAPLAVDATPPALRLVSRRPPRVAVGEPASLRVVLNGAVRRIRVDRAGVVRLQGATSVRTLVVDAWDRAGNRATLRVRRP
jgi:hypothetical protein